MFILLFALTALAQPSLPETPKRPVVDEYFGVKVSDDYRWLEDTKSPEVEKWTKEQDEYARAHLKKLPYVGAIQKQLTKWSNSTSPNYWDLEFAGNNFFALKTQPPKEQPFLVTFSSPAELKEKIIFDPNTLDKGGKATIDFFTPSLDGRYVAVSLSSAGTESGTLHVFDVINKKELPDQIPRVHGATAGGAVAWNADSSGFFYTRYPANGEQSAADMDFYQQIYFHKLGTPVSKDKYSLGKKFPRIAEIKLVSSRDGKHVLALVANGDGGEFSHYISSTKDTGDWTQITKFSDKVIDAAFGRHEDLFLLSRENAPRGKVLHLKLKEPSLDQAELVVPEGDDVITDMVPTETKLYIGAMAGGPSYLKVFDIKGRSFGALELDGVTSVSQILGTTHDEIYFKRHSFLEPDAWFRFEMGNKGMKPTKTAMVVKSPVSYAGIEVTREFAVSKDGTKVPLNIIYKKGFKRNGKNPTLLTAYGGYGISLSPRFRADLKVWLASGGVFVVANVRGGGEYGEEWHKSGMLTKKQNVFDDFIGSAEYLIKQKITSPEFLAIEGGSNGGLLMGAVLTQRPELFKAVVSHVGIYDSIRSEFEPNGAFNITEFGTVKEKDQFHALHAYSPLHHVVEKTNYPTILLLTGVNDNRVNPYHSKKMAARLQASSSSPVYLRVSYSAGHGIGSGLSERIAKAADVYAFLFSQFKMKYR